MFNSNLTVALNNRNMTFAQLAGRCGLSESEAYSYEHADICPDPQTLQKMAEVLNLKVSDIAGDKPLEFSSFGKELRELRERNSLSRDELAKLLNTQYTRVAKWEVGYANPSTDMIDKLSDLFGDDMTALLKKYGVNKIQRKSTCKKPGNAKAALIIQPKTDEEIEYGKRIGKAIRQARKDLGITRQFAASTLGISETTMHRIESGYIPKGNLVTDIKRNFNVNIDALKCEEKPSISKVAEKPIHKVVDVPSIKADENKSFRPAWIEYLDMIESDAEYRRAATALLNHVFNDAELTTLPDSPQANIVLKMIAKGA